MVGRESKTVAELIDGIRRRLAGGVSKEEDDEVVALYRYPRCRRLSRRAERPAERAYRLLARLRGAGRWQPVSGRPGPRGIRNADGTGRARP